MSHNVAKYVENNHPNITDIRSFKDFEDWIEDNKNEIIKTVALGGLSGLSRAVIQDAYEHFRKAKIRR